MVNNARKIAWLRMRVMELHTQGHSGRSIAKQLEVSQWKIRRILADLNEKAKEDLNEMVQNEVPLQFRTTINRLQATILECNKIVEDSKSDSRVKLMALTLAKECDHQIGLTLSDSMTLARAIESTTSTPTHTQPTHSLVTRGMRVLQLYLDPSDSLGNTEVQIG